MTSEVIVVSFWGTIRTMFIVRGPDLHYSGMPWGLFKSSHKEISNLVFLENFSTLQGDPRGPGRQFRAPEHPYIS